MEAGGGGRRSTTLSEQMSILDSSNLRDLLRVRDESRETFAGLTLGAVLGCDKTRPAPVKVNKTLLDIIRDEESGAAYRGLVGHNNRKAWKMFKERLRLRRAGAAWSSSSTTTTNTIPVSDISPDECRIRMSQSRPFPPSPRTGNPIPTPVITSSPTNRVDSSPAVSQPENPPATRESIVAEFNPTVSTAPTEPVVTRLADALAAEREQQRPAPERVNPGTVASSGGGAVAMEEEAVVPVRMSLMALLEETDRQTGVVGAALMGAEAEEEGEEEEGDGDEEGEQYTCCVCMVRHKGAAFIPCGHTFCRLCSRELWVSRGNCPLCNGFILEILDIF